MRKSPMLTFSIEEYETRIGKLLKEMSNSGLDAVILTSDENTFYFSGFRSIVWCSKVSTPATLVITKDGHISLITSQGGAHTAAYTSCVKDIRTYGDKSYQSYTDAIVSPLEERGLANGKIGFEFGEGHKIHLNYTAMTSLFEKLAGAEKKDAAKALWKVRSVKSSAEIEIIRKACSINETCIMKGFSKLREGMTEMDLYAEIMSEYMLMGSDSALPLGLRAGSERYSQGNCPPSHRPIMKGDIILVDGGPIYKGYYSDIIREAVIGAPTAHQQDVFDVAREACFKGIETVKPGIPVSEVCKAVDKFLDESKYAPLNVYKNWCGHSIGVGVHEYPMLDTKTDEILVPGMVFSIEPYIYEENVGSLGVEENILVTETGCEVLTPSDSRLLIL